VNDDDCLFDTAGVAPPPICGDCYSDLKVASSREEEEEKLLKELKAKRLDFHADTTLQADVYSNQVSPQQRECEELRKLILSLLFSGSSCREHSARRKGKKARG